MDKIVIEGGKPLRGTVSVSGSKNASLPILIATLLTDDPCRIENVPILRDIDTLLGLLSVLGKEVVRVGDAVEIDSTGTLYAEAPYDLVRRMRASVVVMGPLLARLGTARVSFPGGCAIGARPIDIHLKGFEAMGASVTVSEGYVELIAKKLKPCRFRLPFPSVGATQNLLLAAAMIPGVTTLSNIAREPENCDLMDFLQKMGVRIDGIGTATIRVHGKDRLHGCSHRVIADRIEAGTFLIAGAFPGNDLTIERAPLDTLGRLMACLKRTGASVKVSGDQVRVSAARRPRPVSVSTSPYPGFPTDLQAQWSALMTIAGGKSKIHETVFENRFLHVAELQRMGAQIQLDGNSAVIDGVPALSGAPVMVSDLRAGAALVLAGLFAEGSTPIQRVYHLDRGYSHLVEKFTSLGARIQRVPDEG